MRHLAVTSAAAMALFGASALAAGDPAAGQIKADTCMGCHGIPGYANAYPGYRVPRLGGQHVEYLILALKGYRDGKREHPTMKAQAATMSDQDIEDIAAYLSQAPSAEE